MVATWNAPFELVCLRIETAIGSDLERMGQWRSEGSELKAGTGCGIMFDVAASNPLAKMRRHQLDWRIEDLQAVAERSAVEWRKPGRGGSHVIFSAQGVREIVSVPSKRPIKPVYIRQFVALIDAAGKLKNKREDHAPKA